ALSREHARRCARDPGAHLGRRLVVAERRVEKDLRVGPRELEERDSAASSGKRPRSLQVRDVAGARDGWNAPERDVLHVTDQGDAHARRSVERISGIGGNVRLSAAPRLVPGRGDLWTLSSTG